MLPASSEGKIVLAQYGPNNALPTEPPNTSNPPMRTHVPVCSQQVPLLPTSSEGKIVLTQYGQNNGLRAELPTLQTNRCGQQVPVAASIF